MSRFAAAICVVLTGMLAVRGAGRAQDTLPAADVLLSGVVTSEEAPDTPLRSARVVVSWTGGETEPVFTDGLGRFSVAIGGGAYHTITATKAGYAPVRIGREPDASGTAVAIRMPKGAAITGSVIDSAGTPVSRASVRIRRTDPTGRTYGTGEYQTDTDDRGEFRVGSLPAGRYAVLLATTGARPVLGDTVPPDSVVDVPAGGERAVLRIDPRTVPAAQAATSYAAGFNAGARIASAAAIGMPATARIQGRVLDESGRPVPAIIIRAFAIAGGAGPVGASDVAGHYEIGDLPPGTYRLVASRASATATVVTQNATGAVVVSSRVPGVPQDGPGQIVVVGPGDQLAGADLTLGRGGVITGQIIDAAGEPLEGITVQAWTRRRAGGRTVLEPAVVGMSNGLAGRRTDDRGQFRLFDLPPGTYYPAATETPAVPVLEVGTGAIVFHPSAVSAATAVPVSVQEGSEAFASIVFEPGPLATVEGQVFDESGEPFHGGVRLVGRTRDDVPIVVTREIVVRDGTFRFANVPPGEYVVQAVARTLPVIDIKAPREALLRFGMAFVTAATDAPASVVIQAGSGSALRGRVLVEGSGGEPMPGPISLFGVPADPELSPAAEVRRVQVAPDGTFEIHGLFGPMRFAADAPAGWHLESMYIDGTNAADDPVTFGTARESRSGVEVVVTRGGAEISGQVSGNPESRAGALIVAGPADPAGWHERSRFVRMTTADRDGRFTLAGLPPGLLVVAAVDPRTVRPGGSEPLSPEDVRMLMSAATPVSVAPNGRASANVRAVQLPD